MIQVHGYTVSGAIDATINGTRWAIPNDASNSHRQMIADWEALGNTIPAYDPPEPEPRFPSTPAIVAAAYDVGIENGEVTGIAAGAKINAGFSLDVGMFMLFFDDEQPDTNFFVRVWDNDAILKCEDKDVYSVTISSKNASGDPVDPESFCVEIIRVL